MGLLLLVGTALLLLAGCVSAQPSRFGNYLGCFDLSLLELSPENAAVSCSRHPRSCGG